jgi:NAD-dependent DNA ligase OB-fold domain
VVSFPTSAQATAGPATRVALTSRQKAARPLRIWFREMAPVADLEPARIGGVEVTRVSLNHPDEIDRKEIRAGDHVIVDRAGDGLTTGTVTSDGRASA